MNSNSLCNKKGNFLPAVRNINHKYIAVERTVGEAARFGKVGTKDGFDSH